MFARFMLLLPLACQAQTFSILYTFPGDLSQGGAPQGGLVYHAGTLYGTTLLGGSSTCSFQPEECGTVFSFDLATKQHTVLHAFTGSPNDGYNPTYGGLIRDAAGTFFGTTVCGGSVMGTSSDACAGSGDGTIYKVSPTGTETILYNFDCQALAGCAPYGMLARDGKGSLYGATSTGGPNSSSGAFGGGAVFKLTPAGKLIVLHSFGRAGDGSSPSGGVLLENGVLYGMTVSGGASNLGTVYAIDLATRKETILHSFSGADGESPGRANLISDGMGNLYGTTEYGGALHNPLAFGAGVLFKLNIASGQETVLYTFANGGTGGPTDGCFPDSTLTLDAIGNLYGTTAGSMTTALHPICSFSEGTVFKYDTAGKFTVLYGFAGGNRNSGGLDAGVTLDPNGNLYGVAADGSTSHTGEIFQIAP